MYHSHLKDKEACSEKCKTSETGQSLFEQRIVLTQSSYYFTMWLQLTQHLLKHLPFCLTQFHVSLHYIVALRSLSQNK